MEDLEKAGAVMIGKTNMDEFAMGSTTETSAYGVTRNPWNTEHVPGGSSGGSAAAVAAEECFFALGSDTGGSIRQPASFCGVVGLKPTYGTVSRYGLIAYGSSLDQIGPLTKDVTDCATVMEAIASHDSKDSTSIDRTAIEKDTDFTSALIEDVKGMKIGIPRDYFGDGLDSEVKEAVLAAAKALEAKGAIVEEFDLSLVEYAIPTYYTIAAAEASSNLERFDGIKYGYRTPEYEGLHNMYLGDIYTISVNLAGLPGISVPCGVDSQGLPIGMQLLADSFEEKKLIQAAYTYEKIRGEFGKKEGR